MGTQELPASESTQDTWNHLLLHRVGHTLKGAQARHGCCVMLAYVLLNKTNLRGKEKGFWEVSWGCVFVFNKKYYIWGQWPQGHNDKGLGVFLVLFLNVCVFVRALHVSSQGASVEVRGQPAGVASPPIRREVGIKVRLSDCQAWQ